MAELLRDEEGYQDLIAYFGNQEIELYRDGEAMVFRPTNLYHFKEFMQAALTQNLLDQKKPFFDAGFGDGRVMAAAAFFCAQVYGFEQDEELAEIGQRHLEALKDQDIIKAEIRAHRADFLQSGSYMKYFKMEKITLAQFFNFYDNAQELLDFLATNGPSDVKLFLYVAKYLVIEHPKFIGKEIWEGDGMVGMVYSKKQLN